MDGINWWVAGPMLGVLYVLGFIVAGALERRLCTRTRRLEDYNYTTGTTKVTIQRHRYNNGEHCDHPFNTPFPSAWPLVVLLGPPVALIWLLGLGLYKGTIFTSEALGKAIDREPLEIVEKEKK